MIRDADTRKRAPLPQYREVADGIYAGPGGAITAAELNVLHGRFGWQPIPMRTWEDLHISRRTRRARP